ncbi:hypothetical protein J31TS4_17350 [Paenibacillus sp. J31TS4]|uniref:hypothetical protein n=1 Tax=Paenibacillus sp. J31TS4 TaxID=2807195 RepID=UPI001B0168B7|nr:hypothetical protein [Paenibacillus sp. J31TS4]GIP38455.1 hypothetical protein J31TS4_17350 [Paenibacillus sp. J31TS4]
MDNKTQRHIVEDLLPLYVEGLLSEETARWVEEQARDDEQLAELLQTARQPLPSEPVPEQPDYETMMKRIKRRLSLYQMLFTAISFYLAMRASLLNESFGFIGWYCLFGAVTYLFYKDSKLVFLLAFVPIFLWSLGDTLSDMGKGETIYGGIAAGFLPAMAGAALTAALHYGFALAGNAMGWLIVKIRKGGGTE